MSKNAPTTESESKRVRLEIDLDQSLADLDVSLKVDKNTKIKVKLEKNDEPTPIPAPRIQNPPEKEQESPPPPYQASNHSEQIENCYFEKINIKLVHTDSSRYPPVHFKAMSRTSTFKKIIARYLERYRFTEGTMRFLFENDIVYDETTPEDLEMEHDEENFEIEVHAEQIGG
jgi:hypothetical protein